MRNPFARRKYGQVFDGPVGFAADGSHYPVKYDRAGNELGLDLTARLLWDADAAVYRYARLEERTHLSLYHRGHAELEIGGEN
jgi:hypothetical protein